MMSRSSFSRSSSIRVGSSRTRIHPQSVSCHPLGMGEMKGKRTAEVVVALRAGRAVRVRVVHEAHPLVRVVLAHLVGGQTVPYAWIDFGHLWPLDDFHLCRGRVVVRVVGQEWPGCVVRSSTCGGPNLTGHRHLLGKKQLHCSSDVPPVAFPWDRYHAPGVTWHVAQGRTPSGVLHTPIQQGTDPSRLCRNVQ